MSPQESPEDKSNIAVVAKQNNCTNRVSLAQGLGRDGSERGHSRVGKDKLVDQDQEGETCSQYSL